MQKHYDLIVLGSGPAGQRAAIHAAKLGKKVLVVERDQIGGSCLHQGTIPSKTLREIAIELHGKTQGVLETVMARKKQVIDEEAVIIDEQICRNGVDLMRGTAAFTSAREVEVRQTAKAARLFSADFFLIATGARPIRPPEIPFNPRSVFDSNTLLELSALPKTMVVLGAGVIGCEYASILAQLGVEITLIDPRKHLLQSADPEIVDHLKQHFKRHGIQLFLDTPFGKVRLLEDSRVETTLGGTPKTFDAALYCSGRIGNVDELNLKAAGLVANDRQLIDVNSTFQTKVPHIYAAGDVIGSPALASASAEQGRIAASHAFKSGPTSFPESFPYGIYTIPEISSVGLREEDCIARGVQYIIGRAPYRELARGKILDDSTGMLKLIVDAQSRRILGVHIIGTGATELVHIGQVAMALGAEIDFFINNVFNYPTLAEAYKVAAYNAYNQLKAWCYLPPPLSK